MNPIGSVPEVPSARGPQVRAPGTGSSTSPPSLATPSLGLPQRQKEKMESAYTGSRQGLRSLLSDTEASSFLGSPLAKGTSQLSLKYALGPLPGAGSAILQTSRKSWIPHDKSSHIKSSKVSSSKRFSCGVPMAGFPYKPRPHSWDTNGRKFTDMHVLPPQGTPQMRPKQLGLHVLTINTSLPLHVSSGSA